MNYISAFSVVPTESASGSLQSDRVTLWKLGNPTDLSLKGKILKAQYKVTAQVLLLLTDDCPYEEGLHIYLLKDERHILDEIHMGQPYTPGILSDVEVVSERELSFSFFGNDQWKLEVLGSSSRMLVTKNHPQQGIEWSRILSKRWLKLMRLQP